MNSIFASSSLSKKNVNQDYQVSFRHSVLNMNCIIVSDGIGSHPRSELSSKFCVNRLKELIEKISDINELEFVNLFSIVQSDLTTYLNETDEITIEERNNSLFGTTLISLIETEDFYDIAYVGNGSIWHISGNFNNFSKNKYVPWNSLNLLNPHTTEEVGKSVLYNFFSKENKNVIPACIRLSKDKLFFGEIIVIASDGLYTNDELAAGKDDENAIWIKADENMLRFYSMLHLFLSPSIDDLRNEDIQMFIDQYLNVLRDDGLMFDDTTIGLIIPEKVLKYQNVLSKQKYT